MEMVERSGGMRGCRWMGEGIGIGVFYELGAPAQPNNTKVQIVVFRLR